MKRLQPQGSTRRKCDEKVYGRTNFDWKHVWKHLIQFRLDICITATLTKRNLSPRQADTHEEKPLLVGVHTQAKCVFTFNPTIFRQSLARTIPHAPEIKSPRTFDRISQGGGTPKTVSSPAIVVSRRHHEPPRTDPLPHSLRTASAPPPSHQPLLQPHR